MKFQLHVIWQVYSVSSQMVLIQKVSKDEGVELPYGKGVIDLDFWTPELEPEAYYAFEYIVLE